MVKLIRNVGDRAYAMSHAAAVGSGCMRLWTNRIVFHNDAVRQYQLEMVALSNIGSALCSTPQSLADAHY